MEEIIIRTNETKQKLIEAINTSELPAFILNSIIKEIQQQLEQLEQSQLQQALQNRKEKQEKEEKDGQD